MWVRRSGADLQYISGLVDDGFLRPIVSHVLPLDRVAEAHELSQSHRTVGKIVLQVADGPHNAAKSGGDTNTLAI